MGIADLRAHPGRILIVFGAPIAFAITGFLLSPAHARYPALDPTELVRIDVDDHRKGQALPPGKVLIIGSGQSGCQIPEELSEGGRDVAVACGRAPWVPRRFGGPRPLVVGTRNRLPQLAPGLASRPRGTAFPASLSRAAVAGTTFTCVRSRPVA
jgi:hypothetical protein